MMWHSCPGEHENVEELFGVGATNKLFKKKHGDSFDVKTNESFVTNLSLNFFGKLLTLSIKLYFKVLES